MTRYYQEISHAGAPYKNYPLRGYGADTPASPLAPGMEQYVTVGADGFAYWNKDVAAGALEQLRLMNAIWMTPVKYHLVMYPSDQAVVINSQPESEFAKTLEALSGAAVVKQWVKDGYTVFLSPTVINPLVPIADKAGDMFALNMTELAKENEASQRVVKALSMNYPIVAKPGTVVKGGNYFVGIKKGVPAVKTAGIGTFWIGAAVIAAATLTFFVVKPKGR